MTDLQTLFHAVDDLNVDEIDQLQNYLENRRLALSHEDKAIEEKLLKLRAALAEFREGITREEWEEVADAMNREYVNSKDISLWSRADDASEVEK